MSGSRQRASSGRRRARRFLVQALYQWQVSGDDPDDVLIQFVDGRNLGNADVEYFRDLMRAIPADVDALDAQIAPLLERSVAMVDPVERGILRLACYELRDRLEVPSRVVIDESVELAKAFGAEQGHRFVNGVVDRLARRLRPREFGRTS
ncbi:transcription antitermination factor NusB [Halofilum ochraceum]|uniref:transcription antitermination factor NusB n=1 Tax=Halofilum ochraceum TaxID=1611323 RepID=UPI0008D9E5BE|nr:transcription antitermination factor NusB [Halofilum ochraceum]